MGRQDTGGIGYTKKYGINVVGIMRGEEVEVNPDPFRPLQDDGILILIGRNQDLQRFRKE